MKVKTLFLLTVLLGAFQPCMDAATQDKNYAFTADPIDVVIPSTFKDAEILEYCIEGIKKNGHNIRRVIVVSPAKLTDKAEWFDEKLYPFSKLDVATEIFRGNTAQGEQLATTPYWSGWYYQQLLKLYTPYVIPGISPNVLVLDSDTVFLRPVKFLNNQNAGLYNPGTEYFKSYFEHAARFVPGLKKLYKDHSGISHHMLFQRCVLDDLFQTVEQHHKEPLWKAFCHSVNREDPKTQGASEYEIYFNFLFARSAQPEIRPLKWTNVSSISRLKQYRKRGYHYVSCHSWLRKKTN
jgi:hypothetical protein